MFYLFCSLTWRTPFSRDNESLATGMSRGLSGQWSHDLHCENTQQVLHLCAQFLVPHQDCGATQELNLSV